MIEVKQTVLLVICCKLILIFVHIRLYYIIQLDCISVTSWAYADIFAVEV